MTDLLLQIALGNVCISLAPAIVALVVESTLKRPHHLRGNEELCCDALVVSSLKPTPRTYADSLLAAIEHLACPVLRPPAIASEINSGGFLERRLRMIVSEPSNRSNSRWLQACVLLLAIVVLPLGIASAQDYEAVGKRLRAAVEAGELTGEQARAMLGTLRKAGGATKDQDSDRVKAYLAKVRKELGAAVEAGKISREDAAKRYEGAERAIRERMAAGRKGDADLQAIWKKLQALVEAGELTEEEAHAKMAAIKKTRLGGGKRDIDYDAIGKKIREAVAAGKLTEEEARAKWAAIKKQADRGSKRITRQDLARAGIEIRKAVAEGRISEEEGRAKMAAMRKMLGEQSERGSKRITREDWEGIKRRIEGAVERGDMTREEADAKYREIRARMTR